DPNPFGVAAAVWGPALIVWVAAEDRRRPWWVAVALIALSWVGVWASGSRTALVAAVIALSFLLWSMARGPRQQLAPARLRAGLILTGVVIFVGVVTSTRLPAVGSARRLYDSLPAPSAASVSGFVKELWNRNNYGTASTLMIKEHPFVGVGPGALYFLTP